MPRSLTFSLQAQISFSATITIVKSRGSQSPFFQLFNQEFEFLRRISQELRLGRQKHNFIMFTYLKKIKQTLRNKNLVVILKGYLIISIGEQSYKNVV